MVTSLIYSRYHFKKPFSKEKQILKSFFHFFSNKLIYHLFFSSKRITEHLAEEQP